MNTPILGCTGTFADAVFPSVSGSAVAFVGTGGANLSQQGVYVRPTGADR